MGRSGSLGEEPGRSPEQYSPPLLFSEDLQRKTQGCYALIEGEVSGKCLSAGHGMDPKSLTDPYPTLCGTGWRWGRSQKKWI